MQGALFNPRGHCTAIPDPHKTLQSPLDSDGWEHMFAKKNLKCLDKKYYMACNCKKKYKGICGCLKFKTNVYGFPPK